MPSSRDTDPSAETSERASRDGLRRTSGLDPAASELRGTTQLPEPHTGLRGRKSASPADSEVPCASAHDRKSPDAGSVGGGDRSRTGDGGFADLCLTTWLRRPGAVLSSAKGRRQSTSPLSSASSPRGGLERVKGLEPSTFCMASRRSSQLSYTRSKAGCYQRARRGAIRARGAGWAPPQPGAAPSHDLLPAFLKRRIVSLFLGRRAARWSPRRSPGSQGRPRPRSARGARA